MRRWPTLAEQAPPLDAWLTELGIEVVDGSGASNDPALSRDLVLDGERRFDLRVTVAWVDGVGLSLWAYYGQEAMEMPRRTFHRLLYANSEYPFVKFALADDDRPMLMTELPTTALSADELGARARPPGDRGRPTPGRDAAGGGRSRDPARLERARRAQRRSAGGVPRRGGGGHAGVAAACGAQSAARADRTTAGHTRLSLAPAVRAAASVAAAFTLLVAGLLPALPLIRPGVARAAEYSMKTKATYEIAPGEGTVRVTVDVTFKNTTPNPPGQFSVFPTIDLAVHDGARNVRAEDTRGRRLRTTVQERDGVNVASVQPRPPVRYRDVRRFALSYTLADGASSDIRIRPSL